MSVVGGYVYFIENVATGAIKVGYSIDPVGRCKSLRSTLHQPLRLIGATMGDGEITGRHLERRIHGLLSADRLPGEWFRPSEMVERCLLACVADPDVAALGERDAVTLQAIKVGSAHVSPKAGQTYAPTAAPPDTYWQGWEAF